MKGCWQRRGKRSIKKVIGMAVVMLFIELKTSIHFNCCILGMLVGMHRQHCCFRDQYPNKQQEQKKGDIVFKPVHLARKNAAKIKWFFFINYLNNLLL